MFAFDDEAVAVLRLVGHVSDGRRATVDDLRRALAAPPSMPLPPTRVQADAALADLLSRAAANVAERGATEIGRADLVEATLEDAARSAGLDLSRLRFVRWRIARADVVAPGLRCINRPGMGVPDRPLADGEVAHPLQQADTP